MYLIDGNSDLVRDFACTLDTGNVMVKNQVVEMLSALSLYNIRGYDLALETLDYLKTETCQRYRFR